MKNFIKGRKMYGESSNLRQLIERKITTAILNEIKEGHKEVVVCVSNFTLNTIEYKTLSECSYADFLDWIWVLCNYLPFMSLVVKNKFDYADGGLGVLSP